MSLNFTKHPYRRTSLRRRLQLLARAPPTRVRAGASTTPRGRLAPPRTRVRAGASHQVPRGRLSSDSSRRSTKSAYIRKGLHVSRGRLTPSPRGRVEPLAVGLGRWTSSPVLPVRRTWPSDLPPPPPPQPARAPRAAPPAAVAPRGVPAPASTCAGQLPPVLLARAHAASSHEKSRRIGLTLSRS